MPADLHPGVEVAPSAIAGHGLRSLAMIRTGAVVVRFAGRPATVAALENINHSCDPNLGWNDDSSLTTTRDVVAGEELTVDYATVIDKPTFSMFCHCETYRCRQVVEGNDWRIPQLRRRYADRWHPEVQRLIDEAR